MHDYTVSAVVFALTLGLLWLVTRKDEKVSLQWKRPAGILFRTAILILFFHAFFVVCDIPVLNGYLFVALFVGFSMVGAFLDVFEMGLLATGWLFYEWIFWFPTRDKMVLAYSPEMPQIDEASGTKRQGYATTNLQPVGWVEIDGKEFEARTSLGFIMKGERVEVEKENGFELVVREI